MSRLDTPEVSSDFINKLQKFSTCDVSDGLLNLYSIKDGGYFSDLIQQSGDDIVKIKANGNKSIVGPAYTVLFESIENTGGRDAVNYIDEVPAGSVMVIGLDKSLQLPTWPFIKPTTAVFGGIMANRAQYLGCQATVVFGRVRDLKEFQYLKYPVLSYGVSSCSSNLTLKPVEIGKTIEVTGGKLVHNRQYIVLDQHGMVAIPSYVNMTKLIRYIEKSVEVDDLIVEDIATGQRAKESQRKRRSVLKEYK